ANLHTGRNAPLEIRVGIATGVAVVGDLIGEGGSQEQAVVGDTPNLAARLQVLAEPGTVMISVGIATGVAVVGDLIGEGGSQEQAVVGDTPNLAARLQVLAEPGTVMISVG